MPFFIVFNSTGNRIRVYRFNSKGSKYNTDYRYVKTKGEFTQYTFFVRFCPFFVHFFFSMKKYVLFRLHFYMPISALTRLLNNGQKFSEKKILLRGTSLF